MYSECIQMNLSRFMAHSCTSVRHWPCGCRRLSNIARKQQTCCLVVRHCLVVCLGLRCSYYFTWLCRSCSSRCMTWPRTATAARCSTTCCVPATPSTSTPTSSRCCSRETATRPGGWVLRLQVGRRRLVECSQKAKRICA